MHVLLIGSGGREHALAQLLVKSPLLTHLFVAPGNPGIQTLGNKASNAALDPTDPSAVLNFCKANTIEFALSGPEVPLVEGIADVLNQAGITCLGPGKEGALLEGSKFFSKQLMEEAGVPTAAAYRFEATQREDCLNTLFSLSLPIVIKADGLAAGKGVVIAATYLEATQTVEAFFDGAMGAAGRRLLLEEFLTGIEASCFVLTDGNTYHLLPEAKDYKRIGDGDTGPNTGGMGAVSPLPFYTPEIKEQVRIQIIERTLDGLRTRNITYRGILFIGLMLTKNGPKVIEYNCRLGDPETEAILPRLACDLLPFLISTAKGALNGDGSQLPTRPEASVAIVLAAQGYPQTPIKGGQITGFDTVADQIQVYHAGTLIDTAGNLVANGGRVLIVQCLGQTLQNARDSAYNALAGITLVKGQYRSDIGNDIGDNMGNVFMADK
jgi:phosphoribosylamine---glycine ligase